MTKQQLLHASKLFMELSDLFKVASEQQEVEAPVVDVIQPLVEVVEGEVVETPEVEADEEQIEDLSSMTIQQLRSLAKSHGLSTKGTKKDLIARINELNEPVEEEIVEDEVEETIEEVTPEVVEDEVEETVEETVEDLEDEEEEIEESTEDMNEMELIQSELEAMEVDELVEILESVELPTKGKKQALISRILEAVADGLLEFFDADEIEEYDADEEDEELDEAIEQALEETDEEDEEEEIEEIEEEVSPREATQMEVEEEILEAYEDGSLTDKEIANFLEDYFNGKFKPINKKRALNKYIEIQCDLVDADGDRMPMGEPYYVSDEDVFCCGSEIKELDNGNLFCEVCGQEYETE